MMQIRRIRHLSYPRDPSHPRVSAIPRIHVTTILLAEVSPFVIRKQPLRMPRPTPSPSSRRDFLSWVSCGLGGAALLHLMARDSPARDPAALGEAADPPPHFPPRARRAIHI